MAKEIRLNLRCPASMYADLNTEMKKRREEKGEKKISLSSLILSLLSSSLAEVFRKREYAQRLREKRRGIRLSSEHTNSGESSTSNASLINGEKHNDAKGA